jgi:hypothetical protein
MPKAPASPTKKNKDFFKGSLKDLIHSTAPHPQKKNKDFFKNKHSLAMLPRLTSNSWDQVIFPSQPPKKLGLQA